MATRREKALEKLRKAQAELAELDREAERFGPEPGPGTVIKFVKPFGLRAFTYAAIRVDNGYWYLTGGESPTRLRWDDLKGFIGDTTAWRSFVWTPIWGTEEGR